MLLYFMRHGEAEDAAAGQADAERRLTERGLQRSRQAGTALQKMAVTLDLILTSPLQRAAQTAEAVGQALGVSVTPAEALAGPSLDEVRLMWEEHGRPAGLMLVGHEPDFSHLVGELLGGADVEMKKGAIACLDCPAIAPGGGTLRWLVTGKHLSLMA
jgi:phosphohistidine phosphatase SixA